jgi:hypothetical protein
MVAILDVASFVATRLGAVLAIAAVAVFYFYGLFMTVALLWAWFFASILWVQLSPTHSAASTAGRPATSR